MANRDPRVDAYIAKAEPFARPILKYIREVVHAACPSVTETIKWQFPHFDFRGPVCHMAAFKAHCSFGFWKGDLVIDTTSARQNRDRAMGQFGTIRSLEDLPSRANLKALVMKAVSLNEAGVKKSRAPRPARSTKVSVPASVTRALATNAKARAGFEAMSPSHKREYVEWIVEAKQDETRERRIATMLEWLAEGKSRNWKYERPTKAVSASRPKRAESPARDTEARTRGVASAAGGKKTPRARGKRTSDAK